MNLRRVLPFIVLVVVMVCTTWVTTHSRHQRSVAVLFPGPVRFFEVERQAMEREAASQNLDLHFFDANWNVDRQIDQARNATIQGFDLIALASVDRTIAAPVTQITKDAGIPLITFTNSLGTSNEGMYDGVVSHIGRDETESGRLLGLQIEALDRVAPRILVIEGSPGTAPQVFRSNGLDEVIRRHPTWSVVDRIPIDGWRLDLVEQLLARSVQKTRPTIIATQWGEAAVVADRYLHQLGIDDVDIVTLEWTKLLVDSMDSGRIKSSTYFVVSDEGAATVRTIARILANESVPRFIPITQTVVDATDRHKYPTEW